MRPGVVPTSVALAIAGAFLIAVASSADAIQGVYGTGFMFRLRKRVFSTSPSADGAH